ncbi:MAG: AI-2E family transporter [Vicinamibacteria bacterium]
MTTPFWRRPLVQAGVVALFLLLVGLALYQLRQPLMPFAVALALAYFLNPLCNGLERVFQRSFAQNRLLSRIGPRTAAVTVIALVVTLLIVAAILFVVPAVYHQVSETVAKMPEYYRVVLAKAEPVYQKVHDRYPAQSEEVRQRLITAVKANAPQILSPVTRFLAKAFGSVLGFFLAVLNLLIIPVFAFYLLFDMNHIQDGMKALVPHRFRPYVYSRFGEVDRLLSAFARGQVTVCLILGVFYAVGLSACGVPMGVVVGFVIGFFNLIPFMSYVLGLPLALVLSWVDDQSLTRLLVVAAVFTFGQFVEGNFITPRIVGQSIGLHAVVIMLAVLVGGTLFGFVGMLLAMPVTAALSVFWADLREAYLKSAFFHGNAPPAAS